MVVALKSSYAAANVLFSDDAAKCAEALQKLIAVRRQHGTHQQVGASSAVQQIDLTLSFSSDGERPLLLASRRVIIRDVVESTTSGPNEPNCIFNL